MKMCKIYRAVFPLILLSLLNGCFSGSGALIQEKDAELERLRSELVELEKRLDNEIIALKEQSSKRKSLDEALKVEQKNNQGYMAEIEQLKVNFDVRLGQIPAKLRPYLLAMYANPVIAKSV